MKGFLFGMGIGVGIGILFAPERGEVFRRKLKNYAADAPNALTAEFSAQTEYDGNDLSGVSGTASAQTKEREEMLDRTLADSFPSSDPPSSIPCISA
jgi:gas vesicle protein